MGEAEDDAESIRATTLIGREETFGQLDGGYLDRLSLLIALLLVGSSIWYGMPAIGLDPIGGAGLAATCLLLPLATMLLAESISRLLRRSRSQT